ncbi:NAD(P)-dependent oxidoreductase [Ruania alkalisoli]|uniref:NAD(P)-dependent oxidoreductase n=1 Tax=Ruania alkalisoli TaxID=2779775 RepID=A0A7M1SVM3_9MICO|nr:NAD(P)-dependent oxidoreductase [Ruania alkalisoli]QOR71636.1 NAD(P)-dependent oxidoreductase [Ruania alkalisoli]
MGHSARHRRFQPVTMPADERPVTILLTGAAGIIGAMIRPRLLARGHRLRCLDVTAVQAQPGEESITGSVTDPEVAADAVEGADVVVHLAAHRDEQTWEATLDLNVTGTRTVLEAARAAGVRRVLLGGSLHAVGMLTVAQAAEDPEPAPHPDTYYGWSKAAMESLGRLYADRFGMTVVTARLGTVKEEPPDARALTTWLSPDDMVRLIEAVATTEATGGHVVWGFSQNTHSPLRLDAGRAIGFTPVDDAAVFADRFGTAVGKQDHKRGLGPDELLAGPFASDERRPVGKPAPAKQRAGHHSMPKK